MDFKEKAGKRLRNASAAHSKVHKRNYGQLSPINQDQLGINYDFQVRDAMIAVGLSPPDQIIFDGQIHRYKIAGDKRHSNNGWYVFYSDGIFSGSFGSWKTGIKTSWCSKSLKLMSSEEKTEYRRRMEDACFQRQQLKAEEQQKAAECAKDILSTATPADANHLYLAKKQITPFIACQINSLLILPITNIEGGICSLQYIYPDGRKMLLKGGRKKGAFILVQGIVSNPEIFIAEGFATAATLAEFYPEACIISALDAGNLKPVAVLVRQNCRESKIVVCADDDRQTVGNPGFTKAREAAIAANALLAVPKWPVDAPVELTDFNDLACWMVNKKEAV